MTTKAKFLALIETVLVFALVVAGFQGLRLIQPLHAWEQNVRGGWPWISYIGLLVFTPTFLAATRRPFIPYGLAWKPVGYHFRIFGTAFLPILLLSITLSWLDWRQWPGALLISALAVVLLIWTAWLLRNKPPAPRVMGQLGGLLLFIIFPLAMGQTNKALGNLIAAYLLVGPAEEMFFRGYAQSRLNMAFGRPFCRLGISLGWGMLISAGLFGIWHLVLNPGIASAWPQALWTFIAGLIFAVVREKSSSVFAPAMLHGVLNYGPQALLVDLFL